MKIGWTVQFLSSRNTVFEKFYWDKVTVIGLLLKTNRISDFGNRGFSQRQPSRPSFDFFLVELEMKSFK